MSEDMIVNLVILCAGATAIIVSSALYLMERQTARREVHAPGPSLTDGDFQHSAPLPFPPTTYMGYCSRGENTHDPVSHNRMHFTCPQCEEPDCCPMVYHDCRRRSENAALDVMRAAATSAADRHASDLHRLVGEAFPYQRAAAAEAKRTADLDREPIHVPIEAKCPTCRALLLDGTALVFCGRCLLPHHEECAAGHKCAAYGCGAEMRRGKA